MSRDILIFLPRRLGFIINIKKSFLEPTQNVMFLEELMIDDQDYVSITKSSVPTLNISRSNIDPHTCKTTTLATRAYCTPSIIVS